MLMNRHHRAVLLRLQVGGCTCMTKTNEVKYHASDCQYRLASEIEDALTFEDDARQPAAINKEAAKEKCLNCNGTGSHGGRFHTDGKGAAEYEPYKCDMCDGFGTVAAPLASEASKPACAHRIVDARNEIVKSGYLCVDCGAVFAGIHAHAAPSVEQDERGAFEALMRSRGEDYMYRRDVPGCEKFGEYCRQNVQDQWEVWQARAASTSANVAQDDSAARYTMDQMRDYALAFHETRKTGAQTGVCTKCPKWMFDERCCGDRALPANVAQGAEAVTEAMARAMVANSVASINGPLETPHAFSKLAESAERRRFSSAEEFDKWAAASEEESATKASHRLDSLRFLARSASRNLAAPSDAPIITRDFLGQIVREAWVKWAKQQPNPKPSWLAPYDKLSEADKEADRQIGEAVAQWALSVKGAKWEAANVAQGAEAVQFVFPPMPQAIVMHEKLGPLFDRLSMHFYADKCMRIAAPPAQTALTDDALSSLLPGTYYMDPPDGGSVTVQEQLQRMAADAARYRWLRQGGDKQARVFDRVYGKALDEKIDRALTAAQSASGDTN